LNSLIEDGESSTRLTIFLSIFIVLALLELIIPCNKTAADKPKRWLNNIVLSVINTALVKLTIPLAGIAAAVLAGERQWGLLNNIVDSSGSINYLFEWFAIVIFLIIFDFTIYFQHRLFHAVPLLWRFHRMHHSDVDYDLTTGIRFHPISIVLSSIIKIALILIMGAPVFAVLLAEVLLNATSMFNHSNLKLPKRFESFLRKLIVTPDMHRIHHSVDNIEHNHNFGFNFPWWDRLFGTYLDNVDKPSEEIDIGIEGLQDASSSNLFLMLWQPTKD
jgi:sterol desaturase/sphingolipid hydroxylase (fatty acid hydroxylase superfamily)